MAIAYVNLTGLQYGLDAEETGIQATDADIEPKDPKEYVKNYQGQRRGFARNIDPEVGMTIKGIVSGTTGIMAAVFGTALAAAPANAPTTAAPAGACGIALTGGWYLDTFKMSKGATAWKSIEAAFLSLPLIA